jgi:hypothetical protein
MVPSHTPLGLFHYLLDGHHKTAAATGGRTVRLLTFISATESVATAAELLQLPETLQAAE